MLKTKRGKLFKILAASALIIGLMTSCGASGAAKEASEAYDRFSIANDGNYYNDSEEFYEESTSVMDETKTTDSFKSGDKTSAEYEDKIIRTASINIDSTDAEKCYSTLAAYAKQNGGREISVSKSSDTYDSYDYINIEAELKISPDKLDDFIALAEKTDSLRNTTTLRFALKPRRKRSRIITIFSKKPRQLRNRLKSSATLPISPPKSNPWRVC